MTARGTAVQESPVEIGSMVSKYQILDVIGRGGYAWVYRATDTFLGRDVAIKILHRAGGVTPDMLRRGQAEAKLLIRLRHPNIVETFDAGMTDRGLLFIVMELLVGRSLFAALRELGRLTEDEALPIFIQIAEAVAYAHSMGAIHRDLKPENIFITANEGAKVLDFGIAKITDDGVPVTTKKDVWLGTVLYMSPEQVQGWHVSFGSDIYSLGTVFWEVLGGVHPMLLGCEAPTHMAVAVRHTTEIPPPIHKYRTDVSKDLSRVVDKAIAKKVTERYTTMAEFAATLRDYQASRQARLGGARPNIRGLAGEMVGGPMGFAPMPSQRRVISAELPPAAQPLGVTEDNSPISNAPTKCVNKRTLMGMGKELPPAAVAPAVPLASLRAMAAELPAASVAPTVPIASRKIPRGVGPARGTPPVPSSRPVTPQRLALPPRATPKHAEPARGTPYALSTPLTPQGAERAQSKRPPARRLGWMRSLFLGGLMGGVAFGAVTVAMSHVVPRRTNSTEIAQFRNVLPGTSGSTTPTVAVPLQGPIVPSGIVSVAQPAPSALASTRAEALASSATLGAREPAQLDEKPKALDGELAGKRKPHAALRPKRYLVKPLTED
jgi:serine/threonine protein kinase